MNLLQPHEGIRGVERDEAFLSLDPSMIDVRETVRIVAQHLYSATLVGHPAPMVRRIYDWMKHPRPGDLVVEESTAYYPIERKRNRFPDNWPFERLGYLITVREEWAETDEEWETWKERTRQANIDANIDPEFGLDEPRSIEPAAWYIQYGPFPAAVCRWVNCSFIAVPADIRQFDTLRATQDGQVSITRQNLADDLHDTGFIIDDRS